jgi:hypothetical protein
MKKELCSGKSEGERRYDLSAILWKYIFIDKVNMGRFIEPHRNKVQLIEGERSFQELRRLHVAKWESSSCGDHRRKEFPFYLDLLHFHSVPGCGFENSFAVVLCYNSSPGTGSKG